MNEKQIKVVAIGNGAINALDSLKSGLFKDIELVAIGSEKEVIDNCVADNKLTLGDGIYGAIGNPIKGELWAKDNSEKIKKILNTGSKICIICALGGGTGSGALPVVVQIAQELNIFAKIIATFPLNLEGNKRNKQSETAIEKTKKYNENIDIIYLNKKIENLPPKSIYKDIFLIANEMIEKKIIKFINE